MPFKSVAQKTMFERAAADPDYAKSRGMTQETARKFIEDAKDHPQRHLPERVKPSGGKR